MTKWVCSVCGYVYEGEKAPEACPVCKAPADKFVKQDGEMSWAAEHVVGVAQGVSEDTLKLVCILQWQELPTEKDIRKSVYTTKKQLMKKQNMLLNSLNY